MSTVLVAQELGEGRGHMAKLAPVVTALRAAGRRVVLAVRDLESVPEGLADAVVQAPVLHRRSTLPPAVSYAEVLLRVGFADATQLARLTDAWLQIIEMTGASVLLAEHAPTALLSARIAGLAGSVMGTGFTLPPRGSPMPAFASGRPVSADRLRNAESHVCSCANTVLGARGGAPLAQLDELFEHRRWLCTLAEFDHVQGRSGDTYAGLIWPPMPSAEPVWPTGRGESVFVYMRASHSAYEAVLKALAVTGRPTLVVSPGLDAGRLRALQQASLRVTAEAVDLDAVVKQCATVVTHGGHGLATGLLCYGVAPVLLPSNMEQWLLARRLETQQLAALVKTADGAQALDTAIACASGAAKENAMRFAAEHPAELQPARSQALVARIAKELITL